MNKKKSSKKRERVYAWIGGKKFWFDKDREFARRRRSIAMGSIFASNEADVRRIQHISDNKSFFPERSYVVISCDEAYLSCDEAYPVFLLPELKDERFPSGKYVRVPNENILRWRRVLKEYKRVQKEMRKAYGYE